jgi:hypothetical protein
MQVFDQVVTTIPPRAQAGTFERAVVSTDLNQRAPRCCWG